MRNRPSTKEGVIMPRSASFVGVNKTCAILVLFLGCWIGEAHAQEPSSDVLRGDDIVVTPMRSMTRRDEVPASVEVLGEGAIVPTFSGSLEPLLRGMTGIDLQGGGVPGARSKMNMRGLSPGLESKRILVLVDGRRISEPYQSYTDFRTMLAHNIERVEVLRGPASALYGSGAMGGVISIETRQGKDIPETAFSAMSGSHGSQTLNLRHGYSVGPLDYYVSASHLRTDGYLKNPDGRRQDWEAWDGTANTGIRLNPYTDLRLHLGWYDGQGRDDTRDIDVRKDYQMLTVQSDWMPEREARWLLRLFRNGEKNIYRWFDRDQGIYRQQLLGAEVQQSVWITSRQRWTAGIEVRQDAVDIDEPGNPIDRSSTVNAFYLQNEWYAHDQWILTLGLRRDQVEDFKVAISPRVAILYKPVSFADLYASYNRAHRAPALSDRFVRVEFRGMQFIGNPDLDPETLTAYEVGGRLRFGDGRFRFSSALFYNDLDDTFEFMFSPEDGTFRNENVSRAEIYGVEVSAELAVTDRTDVFMNAAWTEGTNKEHPPQSDIEGNRLAYLARNKWNAGIQRTARKADLHRLHLQYTGGRYGDAQNSEENRMKRYATVNWFSRVAVRDGLWLTLNIENLTDEDYREYPGYPQPGRTVMAGMELIF